MSDTLTPNYTPEEIEEAKTELEAMKPEDLLGLHTQLELAQDAVNLPEAPAIAWTELRATSGAKINLTVRAGNGVLALDGLAQAVAYARERYGMSTAGTAPVSPAPLPMSQDKADSEKPMPVEAPTLPMSAPATYTASSTPAPSTSAPLIEFAVESIARERKRDGKGDFLRVRGGKFVKFGVPCYPEKFPQNLDVTQMQYGLEYNNIPANMRVATVIDQKPYHVVSFHA